MLAAIATLASASVLQDDHASPLPPYLHRPTPLLARPVDLQSGVVPAAFHLRGDGDETTLWDSPTLLGGALGLEADLAERGIGLELVYVHDLFQSSGGVDSGFRQSRILDLALSFDGETVFGLEGSTFFVDAYATAGSGIGELVGDLQGTSNIETGSDAIIAEVWYEQWLASENFRIKVGKIDGNSEFAFAENAGGFLNSSMGFSPTNFVIPTYPDPAVGGLVEYHADESLALRAGLFDGAGATGVHTGELGWSTFFGSPSDLFLVGELEARWGADTDRPGRAVVGYWEHTGEFARFAGGTDNHARGTHAALDQALPNPLPTGDLAGWVMLGQADEDVSEIVLHVGAGVVWSNFIEGRDDSMGLGASLVKVSDQAGFADDSELAIEWYWRSAPAAWLQLVPDIQYIVNPGADGVTDNALVLGLRIEVALH